jgi:hypothetical protein
MISATRMARASLTVGGYQHQAQIVRYLEEAVMERALDREGAALRPSDILAVMVKFV